MSDVYGPPTAPEGFTLAQDLVDATCEQLPGWSTADAMGKFRLREQALAALNAAHAAGWRPPTPRDVLADAAAAAATDDAAVRQAMVAALRVAYDLLKAPALADPVAGLARVQIDDALVLAGAEPCGTCDGRGCPDCPTTDDISDGFHTFGELYAHRAALFALAVTLLPGRAWRSRQHADGTMYPGMFVAGLHLPAGAHITYHVPLTEWDQFGGAVEVPAAPAWDGHTADDVLDRLRVAVRNYLEQA